MPEVRNIESGEVKQVPAEQVGQYIMSGQWTTAKGTAVNVVDQYGEVGHVAVEDLGSVLSQGYEIADPQIALDAKLQEDYGDVAGQAIAGAQGIARTATIGGSDVVLEALGFETEKYRQANPWTSTTAELLTILGTGGAGALRGVAGLAGRGVQAAERGRQLGLLGRTLAATPAGRVAEAGFIAEARLAQMLGGTKAAQRAAAVAAGMGEAAIWSAGLRTAEMARAGVTFQDMIENPELIGEQLAGDVFVDSLLGGATIGSLIIGGNVLKGTWGKAKGAGQYLRNLLKREKQEVAEQLDDAAEQLLERAEAGVGAGITRGRIRYERELPEDTAIRDIFDSPEQVIDEYIQKHGGVAPPKQIIDEIQKPSFAEQVTKGKQVKLKLDDELTQYASSTSRALTRQAEIEDILLAEKGGLNIRSKLEAMATAIENDIGATVGQPAAWDAAQRFAVETLKKHQIGLRNILENYPEVGMIAGKARLKNLTEKVIETRIDDLIQGSKRVRISDYQRGELKLVDILNYLDDTKRMTDELVDAQQKSRTASVLAGQELEALGDEIRESLENPEIWGEGAATIQRIENAHWSGKGSPDGRGMIAANNNFWRRFADFGEGRKSVDKWKELYAANFDRVKEAYNQSDILERTPIRKLYERPEKWSAGLENKGLTHKATPAQKKLIQEHRQLTEQIKANNDAAHNLTTLVKEYDQTVTNIEAIGLPGARKILDVTTTAGGAARTMGEKVGLVKDIGTKSAKSKSKIREAAKAFFEGREAGRKIAPRLLPPVYIRERTKEEGPSLKEEFEQLKKLHDENSKPELMLGKMVTALEPLTSVSPEFAMGVINSSQRVAAFLQSKSPVPNIRESDVLAHLDDRQRVSDSEMARYLRYVKGALKPLEVIDDFKDGTVSNEAAEALRVCWPQMFAQLEAELMDQLASQKEQPAYDKLVHLSILLGRALHPSLEGRFIAAAQGIHEEARQQQEQAQMPTIGKAPDISESVETTAQRLG